MPIDNTLTLNSTGLLFQVYTGEADILNFSIIQNDGPNTITIERSDDDSAWTAVPDIYRAGGAALGGATITGKGTFYLPADWKWMRARVSAAVGGYTKADNVEANPFDPRAPIEWPTSQNAVVAAGTTSAGATVLNSSLFANVITTPANSGVRIPTGLKRGDIYQIRNAGANSLKVYPPTGGAISPNFVADAPVTIPAGWTQQFSCSYPDLNWGAGATWQING